MATYSSNTTVKFNNDSNTFDTATASQTKSITITPPASGYNITNLFWSNLDASDTLNIYISAALYHTMNGTVTGSVLGIYHSGNALKFEIICNSAVLTRKIAVISSSFVNTP